MGVFPNGTPFVDIRDVYNDKETGEMKWGGKGKSDTVGVLCLYIQSMLTL